MPRIAPSLLLSLICFAFVSACNEEKGLTNGDIFPDGTADDGGTDGGTGGGTGGDTGGGSGPATPPPSSSYVLLDSEVGDFIGAGVDYSYSLADSVLDVEATGNELRVTVQGDESWTGDFALPSSALQIEAGVYPNLTRYGLHDEAVGGLSWTGEGRGCNQLAATLTVESVRYDGEVLTSLLMGFEQWCDADTMPLRGVVAWDATDTTLPPGPVTAPDGLWAPPAQAVPETGNYVYLSGEADEFISAGMDYLYTDSTATITVGVNPNDGAVSVDVEGTETWSGDFVGMDFLIQLEAGYYGDLQRYPFHNQVKGGLNWSGQGRGCNKLDGWFMVDNIAFDAGNVTALELRFAQSCSPGTEIMYGAIRWAP